MTWIAVGLLTGWGLSVAAFLKTLEHVLRQQARERDLLTNQLLHAVGKSWQEAPAVTAERKPEPEPLPDAGRFVASPEQYA